MNKNIIILCIFTVCLFGCTPTKKLVDNSQINKIDSMIYFQKDSFKIDYNKIKIDLSELINDLIISENIEKIEEDSAGKKTTTKIQRTISNKTITNNNISDIDTTKLVNTISDAMKIAKKDNSIISKKEITKPNQSLKWLMWIVIAVAVIVLILFIKLKL